jgi:kynurenine formamidase
MRAMTAIVDPASGLEFHELSHPWGYFTPIHPGHEDLRIERIAYHAKHGAMTQRICGVMHASTHVNAPIHMVAGAQTVGKLPLAHFFGNGVVLGIPKGKWELVTAADLAAAAPAVQDGDMVVIATGWHKCYSDSARFFGHAPGLAPEAAAWLVERKVRLVAVDTPQVDHPLATSLGGHRNGPQIRGLVRDYESATGRSAKADFPVWNAAHKLLAKAGIPTVENVGGDVDAVAGLRCTLHAAPWRWPEGDACVVRLIAIRDPKGSYRLAAG